MVSLLSLIDYPVWLLYRRQKKERQIAVQMVGARLLLLTKLRFVQESRKGWPAPPLNPPALRRIHDKFYVPNFGYGTAKEN